jgi:hypothetical protein
MRPRLRPPAPAHCLPLLLLQALACATDDFQVSTSFDPLTRFPQAATYAWDEAASSLPDDPRLAGLGLGALIREAVDAEMAARGYTATRGPSNYRLSHQLRIHTWLGADRSVSQGSLSLDLVENASGRRVWTGYARADVHIGLSREERSRRLREIAARLLSEFPPSGRPA